MKKVFKDLWARIVIDWKEFWAYQTARWNVKRDSKQIQAAIERAKVKNTSDKKTYYIMRDRFGGINELTNRELDFFTRRGLFPKMSYHERLYNCITIITSNEDLKTNFIVIKKNKKLKANGPGKTGKDS